MWSLWQTTIRISKEEMEKKKEKKSCGYSGAAKNCFPCRPHFLLVPQCNEVFTERKANHFSGVIFYCHRHPHFHCLCHCQCHCHCCCYRYCYCHHYHYRHRHRNRSFHRQLHQKWQWHYFCHFVIVYLPENQIEETKEQHLPLGKTRGKLFSKNSQFYQKCGYDQSNIGSKCITI